MKPSEVFGVVVRTIGLLLTMFALWEFGFALLDIVGGGPGYGAALLIVSAPAFLVGVWFLRGARSVVSFAFPEES